MVANVGGLINRLYGQGSVAETYALSTRNRISGKTEEAAATSGLDRVDLSANAPRPVSASLVEDATSTAVKIANGVDLTDEEMSRIRADRVYAAVAALSALGMTGENGQLAWPGGLPAPTEAELKAAYQRISQRLENTDEAANPLAAQDERLQILDTYRNADFGLVANQIESAS